MVGRAVLGKPVTGKKGPGAAGLGVGRGDHGQGWGRVKYGAGKGGGARGPLVGGGECFTPSLIPIHHHIGFEVWSNLRELEILDLSGNSELDESSIPSLVAVSSLQSLFLNGNDLRSNRTIQQLSTMKLHTLDLGNNNFHGTLSTYICNMGDLEELYI
ncbi:hypothetical protein ACQ4PT_071378 [Festuca glaucescens]